MPMVGTKETKKGCGEKSVIACWKGVGKNAWPVGGTALRAV